MPANYYSKPSTGYDPEKLKQLIDRVNKDSSWKSKWRRHKYLVELNEQIQLTKTALKAIYDKVFDTCLLPPPTKTGIEKELKDGMESLTSVIDKLEVLLEAAKTKG